MQTNIIVCNIPSGIHVNTVEDRAEFLKEIKKAWKTVQYVVEDVDIPSDLNGKELINFAQMCEESISRSDLIELRMI